MAEHKIFDSKPDLKPCPFCGEKDQLYWGHAHAMAFHVQCLVCGGSGGEIGYPDASDGKLTLEELEVQLMDKAIEAWNKRA
ncbi:hypothetical protein HN803_07435 [candidate division WWE3 bacterium]|jgi:Lar family restriction alleviation protein|nr:hypothetical protein [Candidatus Scalindua sp.]MBT7350584.1 hypothetical protein [candidate division WWE3 bacterium]